MRFECFVLIVDVMSEYHCLLSWETCWEIFWWSWYRSL